MIVYEKEEDKARLELKQFQDLVSRLLDVDLLNPGTPLNPWKKATWEKATWKQIQLAIREGAKHLPLLYQENYATPLLDNLGSLLVRASTLRSSSDTRESVLNKFEKTIGILAGAVFCHQETKRTPQPLVIALRCFLAVISNTYRSFLASDRLRGENLPTLASNHYPPLAAFWSSRKGSEDLSVPSMLTSSAVKKLCGGTVGVVVLPTVYKDHPLLWTAIAHEVGGHEMLSAVPELLPEIRRGIRQLFNLRSIRRGEKPDHEQFIGLLWQYWAEETFADVCGILNLGPTYGISLAAYQAAILHAIEKKNGFSSDSSVRLRMWSGVPPSLRKGLSRNEELPPVALDPHPTDILKLHVLIGAVENLVFLPDGQKKQYTTLLQQIAEACANGQPNIEVYGSVQDGSSDKWIRVAKGDLRLTDMQIAARRVGAYIATAELNALGRRTLQEIETWDATDEDAAQHIAKSLRQVDGEKAIDLDGMGDDAHLLAGATLAFMESPEKYKRITEALMDALENSYLKDPIWGVSQFHAVADYEKMDRNSAALAAAYAFQAASTLSTPQSTSPVSEPRNKTIPPLHPNRGRHRSRGTGGNP